VYDRDFDSASDAFKQEMTAFSKTLNKEHYTNALIQLNDIKQLHKENKAFKVPIIKVEVVKAFRNGFTL
tara:strand:+ start:186 stop:392 length:207 start_codon:yes stop_codon:yes gene_type:complete